MKYFSYDKTYQENRKKYLSLCNIHHPDKPTGNQEIMKEINSEWELYKETHADEPAEEIDGWDVFGAFYDAVLSMKEEEETNYVVWRGKKYSGSEDEILGKVALEHGGLSLIEFVTSKQWQDYLNT